MIRFQTHHRNVRYRPPRRRRDEDKGRARLFANFVRNYLWPDRYPLLLCIVLVALNGSSVYLLAFYGRYVVDNILLVEQAREEAPDLERGRRPWARDARGDSSTRRAEGMGRRLEGGDSGPHFAPGASRKLAIMFALHLGTIALLNLLVRSASRRRIIVGQRMVARLRDDLHAKVLALGLAYHSTHPPGRILARIMSDVGVLQTQMMMTILNFFTAISGIAIGLTILLLSDWRVALVAMTVTPLYAIVYRQSRDPLRNIAREITHTNSCLWSLCSQKLDAIKAIQAYSREPREKLDFHRLAAVFLRDSVNLQRKGAAVGQVCAVIGAIGTLGVFVYGTNQVVAGHMSLGKMLFLYATAANLFTPVLLLTQVNVLWSRQLIILQRLNAIFEEPVPIADNPHAVDFPAPLGHGIKLENVSFRYPVDEEGDDPPSTSGDVLRGLSMFVPAGQWACIMGPSGCGKTTLLYLISRLYEPDAGGILVDGVPLANIRVRSLRDRMALVPQEAQLFRGTVRDNIAYGHPDASPRQIMAATKAAEMHELVMGMPVKYESNVSEKGSNLSGGQRQRLSLARALLTDPDVLLLDDCTSALDAATEQKIQQTLTRIMVGKTAIVVSQRVSMAKRCHRIFVLGDGGIVEQGTHEELVHGGGFYSRLHAQQTEH